MFRIDGVLDGPLHYRLSDDRLLELAVQKEMRAAGDHKTIRIGDCVVVLVNLNLFANSIELLTIFFEQPNTSDTY